MREPKNERDRLVEFVNVLAGEDEPLAASLATQLSAEELWEGYYRLVDDLSEQELRRSLKLLTRGNREVDEWLFTNRRAPHHMKGVLKLYLETGNPFPPPQERGRATLPTHARPELQAW